MYSHTNDYSVLVAAGQQALTAVGRPLTTETSGRDLRYVASGVNADGSVTMEPDKDAQRRALANLDDHRDNKELVAKGFAPKLPLSSGSMEQIAQANQASAVKFVNKLFEKVPRAEQILLRQGSGRSPRPNYRRTLSPAVSPKSPIRVAPTLAERKAAQGLVAARREITSQPRQTVSLGQAAVVALMPQPRRQRYEALRQTVGRGNDPQPRPMGRGPTEPSLNLQAARRRWAHALQGDAPAA